MEGGYLEMEREYIKPDAEIMKFAEIEEVMTASVPSPEIGVVPDPGLGWD